MIRYKRRLEDYLSDVPGDYYEEYRNQESDSREIEYIFEDKNK